MEYEGSEIEEFEKVLESALDFEEDDDNNEDEEEGGEETEDDDEEESEEEEGEDDDDQEEEEEEEERENPLSDSIEPNHQFERLEYEALAEKKRKALADSNGRSGKEKKARQDDMSGATLAEIQEVLNFGLRRRKRKSRMPKRRGRRKGSKKKLSPELTRMLGDATLHYAHGNYEEAISVLNEVIKRAPLVADSYHTLGLVHKALGDTKKAMTFYRIATLLRPKDSFLWKLLSDWHIGRGEINQALKYLSKAISADPDDISLRSLRALCYDECGDYQKAAKSYEEIVRICPEDVEALNQAAKMYLKCGQIERSVGVLEDYLKGHPFEADFIVISLLADVFMGIDAYTNALQHIEHAHLVYYSGKELPLELKIKAGICHVHLGNFEKAEIQFSVLQLESVSVHPEMINKVADAYMSAEHFQSALKYYQMVESTVGVDNEGDLYLKIAKSYSSLNDREKAIIFFYKALPTVKDSVDARLALASLLLEDSKEDEAISLLSPPNDLDPVGSDSTELEPWWLDGKIKLKLCHIHRAKGMLEEFVNTILPLVLKSLYVKLNPPKVKARLTTRVLRERTKILDVQENDDIFGEVRPLVPRSDLLKANRAKKRLQEKYKKKAADKAAGIDSHSDYSDDSDDESLQEIEVPPLHNFLKDEAHQDLIIDLCKALQSLQRYSEALDIIKLTGKLVSDRLPAEKYEQLRSLSAQISFSNEDPIRGFDCIRSIILKHAHSTAAWNCYHKITSRLGKSYSKHAKFLRYMRAKHNTCIPPIVISAHQFTMASHHQDAAREYLEAYKLMPDCPLINLCVGSALINLTLGFRLQTKHQCLAQGLAFLYNNLKLAENSQEALYNIARAYHHVGMVSLAASYYEKVLATREKDYPIPKLLNEGSDTECLKPGYCDLRREAAYNLHLIYKNSGALDLARQVLKDHCTF